MDKVRLFKWLRPKLRRLSYQWPPRKIKQGKARVSRGRYECAMCKEEGKTVLYGPKEISLDHIDPVMEFEGFTNFDDFITRLFCSEDGFQVLCHPHHDEKTAMENELRRIVKKSLDNDDDI